MCFCITILGKTDLVISKRNFIIYNLQLIMQFKILFEQTGSVIYLTLSERLQTVRIKKNGQIVAQSRVISPKKFIRIRPYLLHELKLKHKPNIKMTPLVVCSYANSSWCYMKMILIFKKWVKILLNLAAELTDTVALIGQVETCIKF